MGLVHREILHLDWSGLGMAGAATDTLTGILYRSTWDGCIWNVFPTPLYLVEIEGNTLTGVNINLALTIGGHERPQIGFGDAYGAPEAMHNEATVTDPPPDRACVYPESLRDFGDGIEGPDGIPVGLCRHHGLRRLRSVVEDWTTGCGSEKSGLPSEVGQPALS
ncbi:MAG: hypothetical protein WD044_10140 [Dongiaceae bacterium]